MSNGESILTARARKEMFWCITFSIMHVTLAIADLVLFVVTSEVLWVLAAVCFFISSVCGMMSYRGSCRRYFESFNVREISPV